jgi:hypothetical protein
MITNQNSSCIDYHVALSTGSSQMLAYGSFRSFQRRTLDRNLIAPSLPVDFHIPLHAQAEERYLHHHQRKFGSQCDDVPPDISQASPNTHFIEKPRSLSQNPSLLLELGLSLAQLLPAPVHLAQPLFMLTELFLELVVCILSPRTDSGEWRDS